MNAGAASAAGGEGAGPAGAPADASAPGRADAQGESRGDARSEAQSQSPSGLQGDVQAAAAAARRLVRRQALKAAGVSLLPVFGVDLVVNAKLMAETVRRINQAFGLSAEQIALLPQPMRHRVDELVRQVGSYLIGRVVTQTTLLAVVRGMGLRLTAQQAAKLAPLAGAAASAAMSGWLFQRLCERHIGHCVQVCQAMPPELLAHSRPDARRLAAD